jgi:proteic killer suppression protein
MSHDKRHLRGVIKSFRHKGLHAFFHTGKSAKIPANFAKRVRRLLGALDSAETLNNLAVPAYQTHPLKGIVPLRHSMSVNGPWRITFEFRADGAWLVDLEQYH